MPPSGSWRSRRPRPRHLHRCRPPSRARRPVRCRPAGALRAAPPRSAAPAPAVLPFPTVRLTDAASLPGETAETTPSAAAAAAAPGRASRPALAVELLRVLPRRKTLESAVKRLGRLAIAFSVIVGAGAHAEPLDLTACVRLALAHNPDIQDAADSAVSAVIGRDVPLADYHFKLVPSVSGGLQGANNTNQQYQ